MALMLSYLNERTCCDNLVIHLFIFVIPVVDTMFTSFYIAFSIFLLLTSSNGDVSGGILYPRDSESREIRSLDGIWNFRISSPDNPTQGFDEQWYKDELRKTGKVIDMPVPASYNDITDDQNIRDFVGLAWYDTSFYIPSSWENRRVWIRFGSVNYAANVWLNGESIVNHTIGHLPFLAEINSAAKFGQKNILTVAVNNNLTSTTIPQGGVSRVNTDDGSRLVQTINFDFFHYAGIDRPVYLYTTPNVYIDDISVHTSIDGTTGSVDYTINYVSPDDADEPTVTVNLYDRDNQLVATSSKIEDVLSVPDAHFWWPYLMDSDPAYLYQLEVSLIGSETDIYRLPVGIRSVSFTNTSILINGKPFYFRGFGRHEDSDIRGKGLDYSLITRDYDLLYWVGSNGYRTSHYPYAEEIMDLSDRFGIVIVDECPIVNADGFSDELMVNHKQSLAELVRRDKNRPSVILWSIANEALTNKEESEPYFKEIAAYVRSIDSSRGITQAINQDAAADKAAQFSDVISVNYYQGWYSNTGMLDTITQNTINRITAFNEKHNKPVLVTEYGADTIPGLHTLPKGSWSEDYQSAFLSQYFKAFDAVREKGFLVGEMIWNFADFQTKQGTGRVDGNKKGIFTRNRVPKEAALLVRQRYFALAEEWDGVENLPQDLNFYVSASKSKSQKTEL